MKRILHLLILMFIMSAPTRSYGKDYYLIGDWNGWKSSKTFKLQPVYGQDGVYAMYMNAAYNAKNDYALSFIVAPSTAIDENPNACPVWTECLRPSKSDNYVVSTGTANAEGFTYSGGSAAWKLQKTRNGDNNANNGGCYYFVLDTKHNKWSITAFPNVRVLYVLTSENGFQFAGQYLLDRNENGKNYNDNYTGLMNIKKGDTYRLCDGYDWFGSTIENMESNRSETNWSQKIQNNGEKDMPFELNGNKTTYFAEANVLTLNNSNSISFEGARKNIIFREISTPHQTAMAYIKSEISHPEYEQMLWDRDNNLYYTRNFDLTDGEKVTYKYEIYDGVNNHIYEHKAIYANSNNGINGEGVYKAIYINSFAAGTTEPIEQLWLTLTANKTEDGKYIRTFSDWYNREIPKGLKAYYTTNYSEGKLALAAIPSTDRILPKTSCETLDNHTDCNSGWILVYDGSTQNLHFDCNEEKSNVIEISLPEASSDGYEYPDNTYYLKPFLKNCNILEADRDVNNTVTYRNYYFAKYNNHLGFFRGLSDASKNDGKKKTRKAYLHMPAAVQTNAQLDEISTKSDLGAINNAAKFIQLIFDDDITLGITSYSHEKKSDNNLIFNLKGERVSSPQHGIYIVNGKKMVFK